MNDNAMVTSPFLKISKILAVILMSISSITYASAKSEQSIVVLVNDEPISAFDINQRIKFTMAKNGRQLSAHMKKKFKSQETKDKFKAFMQQNRPQSREEANALRDKFIKKMRADIMKEAKPKFYKASLDELIEEKLILQEAKKQGVAVKDAALKQALQRVASRNKNKNGQPGTIDDFLNNIKRAGISVKTYKQSIRARLAMQNIIRRKYGLRIRSIVSAQDIDQAIGNLGPNNQNTEFKLQKVSLSLPSGSDQKTLAKRLIDAEQLRSSFTSCENTKNLVKAVGGTVTPLGKRTTKQIPKKARMFLREAKEGEMTPPDITENSIELYAVCNKRALKGDTKERQKVESELKGKEIAILQKRYLRDLRQDAFIEYRNKK